MCKFSNVNKIVLTVRVRQRNDLNNLISLIYFLFDLSLSSILSQTIRTRHTLNPSSKKNILFQSSRFSPLYQFFAHPSYSISHPLYQLPHILFVYLQLSSSINKFFLNCIPIFSAHVILPILYTNSHIFYSSISNYHLQLIIFLLRTKV